MKRIMICLLACLLALSSCTLSADPLKTVASPLAEGYDSIPSVQSSGVEKAVETVTLFFRYLDEPLLAPEVRSLAVPADLPLEKAIIQALLSGPDVQSSELTGLFPPGVQVRSTIRQGRTLFVTFSPELMNAYADEPQSREDAYWAVESPLRRQLCMQSLVASITENCDVDRVQVLVAHDGQSITDSLRLRQRYFLTGDDQAPADVLLRNDAMLLTPSTTLETILSLWQSRSWIRLARYLTTEDTQRLTEELPHLLDYRFTGGSFSADAQTVTFTLSARLRRGTTETEVTGHILRLHRQDGLWRISPEQLTGLLEAQ